MDEINKKRILGVLLMIPLTIVVIIAIDEMLLEFIIIILIISSVPAFFFGLDLFLKNLKKKK